MGVKVLGLGTDDWYSDSWPVQETGKYKDYRVLGFIIVLVILNVLNTGNVHQSPILIVRAFQDTLEHWVFSEWLTQS